MLHGVSAVEVLAGTPPCAIAAGAVIGCEKLEAS